MTNFSVSPTPLQLVGAGVDNEPLTVQNTGAVSIYLSADPGVSPVAFEYKIDAGGDFTWPPGKSLSVCTGPGVIGQISFGGTGNVRVNSGSTNVTGAVTINGAVPIAGPVTVSGSVALNAGSAVAILGPVAIAGTVPISGNVNIAGGTVALSGPVTISGGVSVNGSTVNVGNAVALANIPVLVYYTNLAISSGAGTYSTVYSTSTIITNYASLLVQISTTSTSAGIFLPVATNYISMTISCTGTGNSGNANSVYNPQWLYTTQGNGPPNTPYIQSLQIPVTNTIMAIQTNVTVGAGFAGNVSIRVYGTGQVVTAPVYRSDGDGFVGTIPEGGTFHQFCNGATLPGVYVSTKSGPAVVSIYPNNSNYGFIYLVIANNGALEQFSGVSTNGLAGGSSNVVQTMFPLRPIYAQLITSATAIFDATIIQP